MEPRQEGRFEIDSLEERIAPATLTAAPPGGPLTSVPPGGATVNAAAVAADGAGGVIDVTT